MTQIGEKNLNLTEKTELRKFGFIIGFILLILGFLPAFKGKDLNFYLMISASVPIFLSLISPNLLLPFYKIWMRLGKFLGKINTFLILSIIFYFFLTPYGIIMKMFKINSEKFAYKTSKGSYWIKKIYRNNRESMERMS